MLFNSYTFIFCFLPIVLAGFFAVARWAGPRYAIGWLIASSLTFYGWWNPRYLLLIACSVLINYVIGHYLSTRKEQTPRRKVALWAGVVFNLGLLGYYKYAYFLLSTFGITIEQILLPLAISFFTFQQIAYVVDAYRGKAPPYRFVDYVFLVTFFPHLIAGPIVQHVDLMAQVSKQPFRPIARNLALGATLFIMGLFKKVVIADRIAPFVWGVYNAPHGELPTMAAAWLSTVAYSFQLYFDFSGYSDMAIGLARLFNFKFPVNFDSPYKAHNIIDFWRRWHMSLSRFLREYLYFSLGGNRKGPVLRYVNLLITMLLGGLWHGAGWGFVLWGGMNGLYLIVNHAWHKLRGIDEKQAAHGKWYWVELSGALTFVCIMLSRVFFRTNSFKKAIEVFTALFGGTAGGWHESWATEGSTWVMFALLWIAVRALPNTQEVLAEHEPVSPGVKTQTKIRWTFTPTWAVATGTMAFLSLLWMSHVSEFLYFQF